VLASCGQVESAQNAVTTAPPATAMRVFFVKGVVQELKADGKTVVIKHEEIPNYMAAMTMPFEVKDTNELTGLNAGDEISFRLLVTEKEGWVDEVNKLGVTNTDEPSRRDPLRRVRFVEPLNLGDAMPDYPFTNELGRAIHLADFKGQALGISFIYTRCPFPNFCPRMSSNFADAYKRLNTLAGAPKNWHLLSISFDPEFDTPAVLRNYAKKYEHDTNHWSFATGALIDIDAITEQFGLIFPREGIGFNHNLRTVVVDAQGNEWKVEDFVEEIEKAAQAK
jgi:protein SCO1